MSQPRGSWLVSRMLSADRSFKAPGMDLCGIAWDGSSLWHSDGATNLLYQLDPDTGDILRELPCEEVRADLSFDGRNLWQVSGHPKRIRVIEPSRGEVLREIDLGWDRENACGLHVSDGSFWVGFKETGVIEERSVEDQRSLRGIRTLGRADGVVVIGSVLWYTDFSKSLLIRVDLDTGTERGRYGVLGRPTGLCWDGSRFWYNDYASKVIRSSVPRD